MIQKIEHKLLLDSLFCNLGPEINNNIAQSVKDGGIFLDTLKSGDIVTVETYNSTYIIEVVDGTKVKITGGSYFLEPTEAIINGSTWGGSMIKIGFIGKGMYMEIYSELLSKRITASEIENIHVKTDEFDYDVRQEELN